MYLGDGQEFLNFCKLTHLFMFSGLKQNQYEGNKRKKYFFKCLIKSSINNYLWIKKMESSQQTESYDKLPRICPRGHAGLKHRGVNIDAAPVLIRSTLKQRLSQFLKSLY